MMHQPFCFACLLVCEGTDDSADERGAKDGPAVGLGVVVMHHHGARRRRRRRVVPKHGRVMGGRVMDGRVMVRDVASVGGVVSGGSLLRLASRRLVLARRRRRLAVSAARGGHCRAAHRQRDESCHERFHCCLLVHITPSLSALLALTQSKAIRCELSDKMFLSSPCERWNTPTFVTITLSCPPAWSFHLADCFCPIPALHFAENFAALPSGRRGSRPRPRPGRGTPSSCASPAVPGSALFLTSRRGDGCGRVPRTASGRPSGCPSPGGRSRRTPLSVVKEQSLSASLVRLEKNCSHYI